MDLFTFLLNLLGDSASLSHDIPEDVKNRIEKSIRDVRRRLMDTERVSFGGILEDKKMKFMRQGGDVELQMVALLMALHKLDKIITEDWETSNLSQEEGYFRFFAIRSVALELFQAQKGGK